MGIKEDIEREAKELLNQPEMSPFLGAAQEKVDEDYEDAEELVDIYMNNPDLDPEDGIEDLIDED